METNKQAKKNLKYLDIVYGESQLILLYIAFWAI